MFFILCPLVWNSFQPVSDGSLMFDHIVFYHYLLFVIYYLSLFFTSAKEVMFSLALVCYLEGLCNNYLTNFHKIQYEGGTLATEETVRF